MMRRSSMLALLASVLLLAGGQAAAIDPESTQAYCDQVRQAAQQAQVRYVQTFKPRQDPGKTFDDATQSCLEGIMSYKSVFKFSLPSIGDIQAILQQMAMDLLSKTCQAARDQFDRAVEDAMNTVNQAGQVPGVGGFSVGPGPASTPAPAPTARPAADPTLWQSVVNFLTGDKPSGDKP